MLDSGTQAIVDTIAQIQSKNAEARERNRRDFPELASVVDMFEREFGKVRVIRASENGKTLGKPDTEKWVKW
jgi:hypothetical protein